jgi:hypothetical protein
MKIFLSIKRPGTSDNVHMYRNDNGQIMLSSDGTPFEIVKHLSYLYEVAECEYLKREKTSKK